MDSLYDTPPSIDWRAFIDIEVFDGYDIDYGSGDGRSWTEIVLHHGETQYRLGVHDLPPVLDGPDVCPFDMEEPMRVMRGSDVKRLPRVMAYHEAREAGLLLDVTFATESVRETVMLGMGGSLDKKKHITLPLLGTGPQVLNPLRRLLYIAHRWQAPDLYDPAQHEILTLVQSIVHDYDFVWVDFWSVPNSFADPTKAASIRSMQAYVFRATALHTIAVSEKDLRLFMNRTWCQAELFAAMCPVLRMRDFACVGSGSGDKSAYTNVYKHACDIEVFVQGKPPAGIELGMLRNPLRCGISSEDDLGLLKVALERVRQMVRDSRPSEGPSGAKYDSSEEKTTGIDDEAVDTMLMALGNLKLP